MEVDLEIDLSTIGMETGEPAETFLVLHRLVEEVSHKTNHTANHEVINLTIFLSADLTLDLRLVLLLTSKKFHQTISRRQQVWFASPQPTTRLMIYQTFFR